MSEIYISNYWDAQIELQVRGKTCLSDLKKKKKKAKVALTKLNQRLTLESLQQI